MENDKWTLKKLSEKTAFLVVFLTLSRYCLVLHLTKFTFPNFEYSHLFLTVLLRASSLSVLGTVVHEGVDGATVELIDLEKVKLIYTNPGCCYYFHYKMGIQG